MDYLAEHSVWMLIMWAIFPRITFWFISSITGGFGFWLGVLFFPHIMVAYWASVYYWDTNPGLCVIAWIIALTNTSAEAKAGKRSAK